MNKLIILFLIFTTNLFAGFPQGSHEKMYKDALQFKSILRNIYALSVNPSLVATPGDPGDVAMFTDGLYIKQDAGTTVNWNKVQDGLTDLTADVTGVLPIANGGTNSGTALVNDAVMISNTGAIVESAVVDVTELNRLDGLTSGIVTLDGTQTLTNKTLTSPVINGPTSVSGVINFTGKFNQGSFSETIDSSQGLDWTNFFQIENTIPSAVTGTSHIGTIIQNDLAADADMAVGPLGFGWVGNSSVSSISVTNGNTVADGGMMSLVPIIPATSDGGVFSKFTYLTLIPPVNQGGTSPITDQEGIAVPSSFCNEASGTCYAFRNMSTDAEIYTASDTTLDANVDISGVVSTAITTDSSSTGSNVTLATPTTDVVRLTNASLASIDMITAPSGVQKLTLINHTGSKININNATGATAANQILTGRGSLLSLEDESSLNLVYDLTETKWMVVGKNSEVANIDYNIITDPGFEGENAQGTCTSCTLSYETANNILASPTNTKYLRVQGSGLTFNYTESVSINSDLEDTNGLIVIWAKTTEGATLATNNDGVAGTTLGADLLNLNDDGLWHKYELPFLFGSTSAGYKLTVPPSSGNVDINLTYVGAYPDGYVKNINDVDTDLITYTPTTQGIGTPTISYSKYKREGDSLRLIFKFTTGTSTAVEAQWSLPLSLEILADLPVSAIGSCQFVGTNTNHYQVLATGGDGFVNFSVRSGSSSGLSAGTGSAVLGTSNIFSCEAVIPIEGWQTGRTDALGQRSEFPYVTAAGNAGETLTANVTDIPFVETSDKQSLWDGDSFTANKDGFYVITGAINFTTSISARITLYDGATQLQSFASPVNSSIQAFTFIQELTASQSISLKSTGGGTLANNPENHHIHIQYFPTYADVLGKFKASQIEDGTSTPNSGTGKGKMCSFEIDSSFDECTNVVGDCISDCENSSTGLNTITWNTDYWSGTSYNCTAAIDTNNRFVVVERGAGKTNTTQDIQSRDLATRSLTDSGQTIICHGLGN